MFPKSLFQFTALLAFVGLVSAHFHLEYPPPRGDFVEDNEPNFCGTYINFPGVFAI